MKGFEHIVLRSTPPPPLELTPLRGAPTRPPSQSSPDRLPWWARVALAVQALSFAGMIAVGLVGLFLWLLSLGAVLGSWWRQ